MPPTDRARRIRSSSGPLKWRPRSASNAASRCASSSDASASIAARSGGTRRHVPATRRGAGRDAARRSAASLPTACSRSAWISAGEPPAARNAASSRAKRSGAVTAARAVRSVPAARLRAPRAAPPARPSLSVVSAAMRCCAAAMASTASSSANSAAASGSPKLSRRSRRSASTRAIRSPPGGSLSAKARPRSRYETIAIEQIDGFTLGGSTQPGVDCAFDALANAIVGLLAGGDEEVLEEAAQRRADQQVSVSIDRERAIDVGIAQRRRRGGGRRRAGARRSAAAIASCRGSSGAVPVSGAAVERGASVRCGARGTRCSAQRAAPATIATAAASARHAIPRPSRAVAYKPAFFSRLAWVRNTEVGFDSKIETRPMIWFTSSRWL